MEGMSTYPVIHLTAFAESVQVHQLTTIFIHLALRVVDCCQFSSVPWYSDYDCSLCDWLLT